MKNEEYIKRREFIIAQPRKRVLKHKWKPFSPRKVMSICEKCGCIKEWDFHFSRYVYYFPNSKGITFIRPECKL